MSPDRERIDLLVDALRQLADAATLVAAWLDDLTHHPRQHGEANTEGTHR